MNRELDAMEVSMTMLPAHKVAANAVYEALHGVISSSESRMPKVKPSLYSLFRDYSEVGRDEAKRERLAEKIDAEIERLDAIEFELGELLKTTHAVLCLLSTLKAKGALDADQLSAVEAFSRAVKNAQEVA